MEKGIDWRDLLDFGTCQRPDGTYYGHGGAKCHKGTEAQLPDRTRNHEVFGRLNEAQAERLTAALLSFETKLDSEGYQEDAKEDWRNAQSQMLTALNASGQDKGTGKYAYTEEQIVSKAEQQLDKAKGNMVGRMPTHLDNGSGTFTSASLSMEPQFGASQLKWRDPVLGDKYGNAQYTREKGIKDAEKKATSASKKGDESSARIWRQRADDLRKLPEGSTLVVKNGVAPSRFSQWQEGNSQKLTDFKAAQERAGKPWPSAETKNPSQKEVDDFVKANPSMWTSGFNTQNRGRGRDDAFDVYEAGSKSPSPQALAARENKNRAIAESYLAHGGRSPVTGQPIQPPKGGLPSTKTVVDHVTPYRDIVKANPGRSIHELDAIANRRSNFMVVESDINNSKGDRSWAKTASNIERGGSTAAVRRSVTDSWNERGSKVTLSQREFESRYGTTQGFTNPSQRQRLASAYEQDRLAKVFGVPREQMVPTARNRNSRPVSEGFTAPRGTVALPKTGAPTVVKAPAPKPTVSKTPAPKTASTAQARVAKQRATQSSARTANQREAKLEKLSAAVTKARADRDKHKPGSAAWNKKNSKVSEVLTLQRRFKKDEGLL